MIDKILAFKAIMGACVFVVCAFAVLTKGIGISHAMAALLTVVSTLCLFTVWTEIGILASIAFLIFALI